MSRPGGTTPVASSARVEQAAGLGERLVAAWGSWGPTMTRNARRVAFVSDRHGTPEVFVQDVVVDGEPPQPVRIRLSDDPVVRVTWSSDGEWLAVAIATDGGVKQQVWVVRPDGSDAAQIAGSRYQHAELGPWSRSGHRVVITLPSTEPDQPARSYLVDPVSGDRDDLAVGELIHILDLSVEERLVVLRDGQRGHEFVVVVDRLTDESHALLTDPPDGSAEIAFLRPAPASETSPLVAYVATEAGLPRRQLVAQPVGPHGWRGQPRRIVERVDAELEYLDADDAGRTLLLGWNVDGRSELDLINTHDASRTPVPDLPGYVVTDPVLSRDGRSVILAVEGPTRPRELWRLDTNALTWSRVTDVPVLPGETLVEPTLERFAARDGLEITGWLYRAAEPTIPSTQRDGETGAVPPFPRTALVHLHGGPESQERPTFSPQHQALAAAGITVFAPNIRGSSGYGHDFVHADDLGLRWNALADVVDCARFLVSNGYADRSRVAVEGRSYGGYATLASLAFTPDVFAAGVAICGMSDFATFYRDTEPWIAAAAATKYGHPVDDAALLGSLSPMRAIDDVAAPLLVVHGELDTNVPIGEAHQVVAALRERSHDVEYLELEGEGHEYRRASSRAELVRRMVEFVADRLA
ncbi:alpha/beta fold hydrolase [Curtobacterium pusillum]|uniref:Prolyl oligopeptidase family serine peptidase n=1 Tax=Curtobacterium pusillum TaxID=69373 RepID=A0ABX2MF33_9MICO|nr:prolyl oligopeptidase family serine peptidase [Curtobacterium pusillum]NUU15560.1 prolyl oligopeptidase family serine peptidase [Curtobacterium pusillum]GLK32720.1 peptidase S9 [Curtobacterium pusillum]